MIDPTADDLGRAVIYTCHPLRDEEGVIHSFNDSYVFVLYRGDLRPKATSRADLEWAAP